VEAVVLLVKKLNQVAAVNSEPDGSRGVLASLRVRVMAEPVQAQIEQAQLLEEQLNKLGRLVADQEMEISAAQEQVETSRREADYLKLKRAIALYQRITQTPDKFRV